MEVPNYAFLIFDVSSIVFFNQVLQKKNKCFRIVPLTSHVHFEKVINKVERPVVANAPVQPANKKKSLTDEHRKKFLAGLNQARKAESRRVKPTEDFEEG